MNNFPKENPWLPIDIKLRYCDINYGRFKSLNIVRVSYDWINKFYPLSCMKLEIKNPDGKIKKISNSPSIYIPTGEDEYFEKDKAPDLSTFTPMVVWKGNQYYEGEQLVLYPASECQIRHEDKLLKHTRWVLSVLKEGDFVKCTGTRSGDWNKVEALRKTTFFGPKYKKPEEGTMRYTSSENSYTKIRKIVRDGKEIKHEDS